MRFNDYILLIKIKIKINPRSLKNLENICEVLYKLHPSVLDYLVDMQRRLGSVLGWNDLKNLTFEKRELLTSFTTCKNDDNDNDDKQEDNFCCNHDKYSSLIFEDLLKTKDLTQLTEEDKDELIFEDLLKTKDLTQLTEEDKDELIYSTKKDELRGYKYRLLRKYIQLDTDEYIPIKIYVEVEDPVIGRKVRELVRALETTGAPEQFYLNKIEIDEKAYFAEGYGLTMNEEQRKKSDKLFWGEDVEGLKALLEKEKLYP